jgi:hypothetical protein
MHRLLPSLLVTSVLVGALSLARLGAEEVPVSERPTSEIQVGDVPGGFALNDHEGRAVRLGHGKDHGWFVLAFYPKASTGG